MNDSINLNQPSNYSQILHKTNEIGFTMPSDLLTGSVLRTLASSKPNSRILELGTGTGLSLSWLQDGIDTGSEIVSIDNNEELSAIAKGFFNTDARIEIICTDASIWLKNYKGKKFDLIFADAWPGKYSELEEAINVLTVGGLYIIDDMLPQPNWPVNHQENVDKLIQYLENRKDLIITKLNWSTGIVIATKKSE